jgi:type III secretion system low calcium response chaperone LcrH/SycD
MTEKKDPPKEAPKPIHPDVPITSTGQVISSPVTPDWQKILYTPERSEKYLNGELNLREYHAISGPEMLQMAQIAFNLYSSGRYTEAETMFNGLIALEPTEAYYHTALGCVYMAQDEYEKAKEQFDHALALDPKELASYLNRGEVHLRLGNIMEAANDLKACVDLDKTGKDPLAMRARVLAAAALELIEGADGGGKPAAAPAKKAEPAKAPPAKAAAAKKAEPAKKAAPAPAKKK